jgi:hypothetical protein
MPTGTAAGRRERLPAGSPEGRPAIALLTTWPVRGEWLQAVGAQRGEIDHQIDPSEELLAKAVFMPVEHWKRQARYAPGRKAGAATVLAFRA